MPGLRAPSDARTQGVAIVETIAATEDAAARRVIASRAPEGGVGRITCRPSVPEEHGQTTYASTFAEPEAYGERQSRESYVVTAPAPSTSRASTSSRERCSSP